MSKMIEECILSNAWPLNYRESLKDLQRDFSIHITSLSRIVCFYLQAVYGEKCSDVYLSSSFCLYCVKNEHMA